MWFREDNNARNGSMQRKVAEETQGKKWEICIKRLVNDNNKQSGEGQASISQRHLRIDALKRNAMRRRRT